MGAGIDKNWYLLSTPPLKKIFCNLGWGEEAKPLSLFFFFFVIFLFHVYTGTITELVARMLVAATLGFIYYGKGNHQPPSNH